MPIYCPECGKKTAVYGYHCIRCGLIYGVADRSQSIRCPKCKSDRRETLTPEIIAEAAIKKKKKSESTEPAGIER